MIDRREMIKLVVMGVAGAAAAGSFLAPGSLDAAAHAPMRFSVEGDMGVIHAAANGESIQVSGDFASRATFAIG
jgi:hypothetical protein